MTFKVGDENVHGLTDVEQAMYSVSASLQEESSLYVVYFDQGAGASIAIFWSNFFLFTLLSTELPHFLQVK